MQIKVRRKYTLNAFIKTEFKSTSYTYTICLRSEMMMAVRAKEKARERELSLWLHSIHTICVYLHFVWSMYEYRMNVWILKSLKSSEFKTKIHNEIYRREWSTFTSQSPGHIWFSVLLSCYRKICESPVEQQSVSRFMEQNQTKPPNKHKKNTQQAINWERGEKKKGMRISYV